MIFQFGRSKGIDSHEIHDETINRWRTFSGGAQAAAQPVTLTEVVSPNYAPEWPDAVSEPIAVTPSLFDPIADERPQPDLRLVEKASIAAPIAETGLSVDQDLRRRFGGNVRSALGPGTVIEGKFSFDGPVRVDGTLTGEINSSSALIVGEQAQVNGTISVGSLVVLGMVEGPVHAEELVEIKSGGQLDGDIVTAKLIVEDGGCFNGLCNR